MIFEIKNIKVTPLGQEGAPGTFWEHSPVLGTARLGGIVFPDVVTSSANVLQVPFHAIESDVQDYWAQYTGPAYATQSDMQALAARIDLLEAQIKRITQDDRPREELGCLNTLEDETLALLKPIGISLEHYEDGSVIARWGEALLSGEADSQLAAIAGLRAQIALAYRDLRVMVDEGSHLAGYPERLWRLLREFVGSA